MITRVLGLTYVPCMDTYTNNLGITIREAQRRIGANIEVRDAIPVKSMLARAKVTLEQFKPVNISKTKESVYDSHVTVEGYPGSAPDFTEATVNDLVYAIVCPTMFGFFIRYSVNRGRTAGSYG